MAGIGPPPKRAEHRARRNKQPVELKLLGIVESGIVLQPELPDFDERVTVNGKEVYRKFVWPERTREWWRMWAESPLSVDFTASDWDFLLDTALLHAKYWLGDTKLAGEIRLRCAKFGQTPEDRLRLRVDFGEPQQPESNNMVRVGSGGSRDRMRRSSLRVVEG